MLESILIWTVVTTGAYSGYPLPDPPPMVTLASCERWSAGLREVYFAQHHVNLITKCVQVDTPAPPKQVVPIYLPQVPVQLPPNYKFTRRRE